MSLNATVQGISFDIKLPSKQLKKAMAEARDNKGSYHNNIEDMIKDLKSND